MVKVVSSSLVTPEVETPEHGLWLSNLDLFAPRAHTPTVYFYRPNGDSSFFSAEVLKAGLRKALVPFYPLAGRLGTDSNGRVEIKCNGKGVLFVEAESELTVQKFDYVPSPDYRKQLIPVLSPDSTDEDIPLLLLQVTTFKCGGVCLGVGLHHYVSDGVASLHFINSWSDVTRGIDIAVHPFLDRTVIRARSPPTVNFNHTEYKRNPQSKPSTAKKPATTAILKLSPDQLTALKNLINSGDGKTRFSTYEVLAAHVWQCACRARGLEIDQDSRVYITADARHRLRPSLPRGFMGNAIVPAATKATVGEVLSNSLEVLAGKIRQTVGRLDDEYLRSALDFLEVQEEVGSMGRWAGNFPATDLSIVSWTRLPIYEADFGWGRPIFMGPASFLYAGLSFIMPNPVNDGGLSVALSLEEEHMARFTGLFYQLGCGAKLEL